MKCSLAGFERCSLQDETACSRRQVDGWVICSFFIVELALAYALLSFSVKYSFAVGKTLLVLSAAWEGLRAVTNPPLLLPLEVDEGVRSLELGSGY